MGLGFRLNLKWGLPLQSHLRNNSKLFSSSSSSSSSSLSGKESCFSSSRLSFLSLISEESESFFKDAIKACTFSSASPQTLENGQSQMEDNKLSYGVKGYTSNSNTTSHFSLLMQNLGALEESFADSDVLRLETQILLQLGRLGALNLFNTCLSRSLENSSFLDLSSIATDVEESGLRVETDKSELGTIVRTGRSEERKSRKRRLGNSNNVHSQSLASATIWQGLKQNSVSSKRRSGKSRSRWHSIAKNEEEMSTGVKMVAKLEQIRTALEKETDGVASLSRWAEAAGLNEHTLQQQLHFGWHCRDELIRSTKSLVLYIARNYRGLGLALDDLLQVGKLGVLQGAERFDHTRGYRFSTYVHYWIRKSMSKLVAQHSRGILIPPSLSKAINQIQKTRKAINNNQRKYPDDDEIAKLTGLSLDKIRSASNCLRVVGSVDQKISDCFSGKRMEFMEDASSPEENVMRQHMRKDIHNLLAVLDSRERQVLILRYGLSNRAPKSLEEIGTIFQLSKEWIWKIEKKALMKLRADETNRDLCHYLKL